MTDHLQTNHLILAQGERSGVSEVQQWTTDEMHEVFGDDAEMLMNTAQVVTRQCKYRGETRYVNMRHTARRRLLEG